MAAVRKAVAARSPATTPAEEIAAFAGDPDFMTSLARGMAVMRAFTRSRRNLTVAELSRKTGLSRACVRRCLHTLEKLGYVEADERVFSLKPKVLALGYSYLSSAPLADIAQPLLERVSLAVQESSSLGVLDGDEVVYVARSATRRIMSVALNVGSRLPAYCTSLGRVALSALDAEELRGYFERVKLRPLTPRTITAEGDLGERIRQVRTSGFALVDQELEIGLRAIAVPVRDATGAVVAAMNVSAQATRVTLRDMERTFLPPLREAAHALGLQLDRGGRA
jgi:IclR family pca regulon transcriptional regulator